MCRLFAFAPTTQEPDVPLITLTCDKDWYPPDEPINPGSGNFTDQQLDMIELAVDLPRLITSHQDKLQLEPDTPADAVQVNIGKFHALAINSPNLWVKVELTEQLAAKEDRVQVINWFFALIDEWLEKHDIRFSWALDVFWGPGHGCYTNSAGQIVKTW